jgi:hypothetical protein
MDKIQFETIFKEFLLTKGYPTESLHSQEIIEIVDGRKVKDVNLIRKLLS